MNFFVAFFTKRHKIIDRVIRIISVYMVKNFSRLSTDGAFYFFLE